MAGTLTPTLEDASQIGTCRVKAVILTDAAGVASAVELPAAVGKLVGLAVVPGTLEMGLTIFSITDAASGAAIATIDTLALVTAAQKFSGTTTGDTTGGAAEDLWTTGAAHGLVDDDRIVFTSITGNGANGPTIGTAYFVDQQNATTFILRTAAAGGGSVVNVGDTDASAAAWFKVGGAAQTPGKLFRPTAVVTDNVGVAVAAADTAPNVNRDIYLKGPVKVSVADGGNVKTGELHLIVAPV